MTTATPNGEPIPFALTETDKQNLAQGDASFQPHTWEELRDIIAKNDLSTLKRKPSDLTRYIAWTNATKAAYGSMTNFVLRERLHWTPLPSSTETGPVFATENPTPFADPRDYKILPNDWPYGMEPGITHLVVWLKTRLEAEGAEGHMTAKSRALVDGFVRRVFRERVGEGGKGAGEKVLWFRNWTGLQSVRGLEHVHVLVRGVERGVLDEWVGGGES